MLQTALPKRRRQNPDQVIALAVVVNDQGCECLIGQARRVGAGPQGNLANVATRLVENANYCSTAVVAPLENRSGHRNELPEQIEGFRRVGLGDHLDDSAALTLEVIGQGSRALPVDKRPGPGNVREPLAHLLDKLGWALCSGQLQPQTSSGSRVAGTDFDQQFGQSFRTEAFEVFRVKGCFCGHSFYSAGPVETDSLAEETSFELPVP